MREKNLCYPSGVTLAPPLMTRQSSRRAYCAHSSRIFSFELRGEKIDPNLIISQNHEKKKKKEKEEDHNLCLNSYGSSIRPCNNYNRSRAFSFELFGEKIDPNLNHQCDDEKLEKEDDQDRFRDGNIGNTLSRSSSMEILDACNNELDLMDCGYLSDGALPNGSSHYIHDNKKGLPWTRDEHKSFLVGLGKLGKGDWRGISKKYVQTRTPTQVASHAQKYFIRKEAREKGKRRSSLFDMPDDLMRYHNNSNEHKSSNPECSKMVPFGPNMNISGLNPFNSSWTQQHTSQALFIPQQPLTIVDGSTWPGVVASRNKEDVPQTK